MVFPPPYLTRPIGIRQAELSGCLRSGWIGDWWGYWTRRSNDNFTLSGALADRFDDDSGGLNPEPIKHNKLCEFECNWRRLGGGTVVTHRRICSPVGEFRANGDEGNMSSAGKRPARFKMGVWRTSAG